MEKRRQQRRKRRLTCEVVVDGQHYTGIVRDHSASGVFVQTRARPRTNSLVEVVFRREGSDQEIRVEAGVARERIVPTGLQSSMPGGVGLELLDAPRELFALLEESMAATPVDVERVESAAAAPAPRSFRVRVKERGRANSRVITVRCESAQAARARALVRAGPGWIVADIQEF